MSRFYLKSIDICLCTYHPMLPPSRLTRNPVDTVFRPSKACEKLKCWSWNCTLGSFTDLCCLSLKAPDAGLTLTYSIVESLMTVLCLKNIQQRCVATLQYLNLKTLHC